MVQAHRSGREHQNSRGPASPDDQTDDVTRFFDPRVVELANLGSISLCPSPPDWSGQESLARSLLRLTDFGNHDFWLTVIRWLIDHSEVEAVHHGPIIDFMNDQKYVPSVINTLSHSRQDNPS